MDKECIYRTKYFSNPNVLCGWNHHDIVYKEVCKEVDCCRKEVDLSDRIIMGFGKEPNVETNSSNSNINR